MFPLAEGPKRADYQVYDKSCPSKCMYLNKSIKGENK